jgi:hypothetical protein
MLELFFVTTLAEGVESRCVGLFDSLSSAQAVLTNNLGDLNEDHYYEWAVIEQVQEFGLYPRLTQVSWWEWRESAGYWGLAVRPACYERTGNFAIG